MSESISNRRWKNRRKMAYISLISLVVMTVWILGLGTYAVMVGKSLEVLQQTGAILSTLAVGFTSIIGAYVGFATWDDKKKELEVIEKSETMDI